MQDESLPLCEAGARPGETRPRSRFRTMGGGRVLGGTGSSTRNKQQTKRGKLITVQDDPHRPRKTKCNCDNVAALTRVIAADPDHPSFQQQQQILPRNLLRTCRCHPRKCCLFPTLPPPKGISGAMRLSRLSRTNHSGTLLPLTLRPGQGQALSLTCIYRGRKLYIQRGLLAAQGLSIVCCGN